LIVSSGVVDVVDAVDCALALVATGRRGAADDVAADPEVGADETAAGVPCPFESVLHAAVELRATAARKIRRAGSAERALKPIDRSSVG